HIPFHYKENCVAYTGTHDNNTVAGWYSEEASPQAIRNLALYLGRKTDVSSVSRDMIRLVELSVAKLVIIPFQDILGLDSSSRMNKPASREGNWRWRMHENMMRAPVLKWFKEITGLADRC
ncbi:MAG: 4-alpha-glucanotransferase, partial [Acetomicrobium sp.]|nr:4-alpha-glucanotransferase [Acetomicrobium sp.]